MPQLELSEFPSWDNERIRETLLNRTQPNVISSIISTRDYIQSVIDIISKDDYPEWFFFNMMEIIRSFLEIVKAPKNASEMDFQTAISKFKNVVISNYKDSDYPLIHYTLPFLENYARNIKLSNSIPDFDAVDVTLNVLTKKIEDENNAAVTELKEKFETFKNDADITLALVKKDAGRIGVKEYAEIFEKQAFEHSNFFINPSDFTERKFALKLGKAQWWIIIAVITFVLLIYSFTQLDVLFSLKNQYLFTPEVVVHIVGRFLLISLFIFIVSFCFKQFRVNMHLYTLNKHRANTLKSFEYLSRAPDPLDAQSYNAILMEVAKAIYESGQTGYINIGDNNADMPSIIDLSKVITQPKS
jgi:hypothetical protein